MRRLRSGGDVRPERTFATIPRGDEPAMNHASALASPATAEPFGDIHNARIAAHRSVTFTEDNANRRFYINGQLWDPNAPPMFTVKAGTVEEWTVLNYADELHAFHISSNPFLSRRHQRRSPAAFGVARYPPNPIS